jgi:hypothetical protein
MVVRFSINGRIVTFLCMRYDSKNVPGMTRKRDPRDVIQRHISDKNILIWIRDTDVLERVLLKKRWRVRTVPNDLRKALTRVCNSFKKDTLTCISKASPCIYSTYTFDLTWIFPSVTAIAYTHLQPRRAKLIRFEARNSMSVMPTLSNQTRTKLHGTSHDLTRHEPSVSLMRRSVIYDRLPKRIRVANMAPWHERLNLSAGRC